MSKKTTFNEIRLDLTKHDRSKRRNNEIKFVIIHYTNLQSTLESLKHLCNPFLKVSSHYLISENGVIFNLVSTDKSAWHAGKSKWSNYKNLNRTSIGIELQNKGHKYGYEKFSKKQIKSLLNLCLRLKKKFKIKSNNFLGHSDIAPLRKFDPGVKFPWKKLSHYGLGKWYKKKLDLPKDINSGKKNTRNFFFKNLHKIGYRYFSPNNPSFKDKYIIKAFKAHFNPSNKSIKIDKKSLKISHILANSL